MYSESILNNSEFEFATSLGMVAAAFRVAAAQMIRTDDLTDTAEDQIRGAERQHLAGWLCTMAAELEGIA